MKTVNVPNFSSEVWQEFKGETVKQGKKIADALEEALKLWLEKNINKNKENPE